MKTKRHKKEISTVEQLREIRDRISAETQHMTLEQLKKYIEEQLKDSLHPASVWR